MSNETTPWIKASTSGGNGNCVEQRRQDRWVEVRDSKDRNGPVLRFTRAEFATWLSGARGGEFDRLLD